MSIDERRKYLKLVAPRYASADGKRRSGLHVSLDCVAGLRRGYQPEYTDSRLHTLHERESANNRRRRARQSEGNAESGCSLS